jgi:hypothetical protein
MEFAEVMKTQLKDRAQKREDDKEITYMEGEQMVRRTRSLPPVIHRHHTHPPSTPPPRLPSSRTLFGIDEGRLHAHESRPGR